MIRNPNSNGDKLYIKKVKKTWKTFCCVFLLMEYPTTESEDMYSISF